MDDVPPVGLLLCDDLIFTSKVIGTARAAGQTVSVARTSAALLDLTRQHRPKWVILDLGCPDLKLTAVVEGLNEACQPRIAAYGSHVDVEALKAARAAGCDPVLPRSKFVEDLPQLLGELSR